MKYLFLFLIRLYQLTLSPFLGKCCRFYPSCSDYAIEAVKKHGAWKGAWLTAKRLVKCQPWHPGGVDEVPN
ncbi:MAG: membrane protein insertion efficiency factor YidD [Verrucomicrobia bacterium]|nr:membrane protein insertion efficiency factor YidD [Verrucomicrobiota bacterium]